MDYIGHKKAPVRIPGLTLLTTINLHFIQALKIALFLLFAYLLGPAKEPFVLF